MPSVEVGKGQQEAHFSSGAANGSGLSLPEGGFPPRGDGIQISSRLGEDCFAPKLRKTSPVSEIMGKLWDLWKRLKEG